MKHGIQLMTDTQLAVYHMAAYMKGCAGVGAAIEREIERRNQLKAEKPRIPAS